jgi:tRNA (adenine57-N1/adenine58-N1)-methyltransferase
MDHFYLEKGKILNNRFGHFHHDEIIGKPFGSRIFSKSTSGYMYALEPSPELWALASHTRTQIVNELDACFVILNLDLFPGCVVVESGTGSGCMTLAMARTVAPHGHVHTFEYNETRAIAARKEFEDMGVGHLISVTHRDVCAKFDTNAGGFTGVPDNAADAVFLDLPEPWLAIDDALRVIKPCRTICCYSPCIEQVIRTCEKLREAGFHSIRMLEVRQRPYDARRHTFETPHVGRDANGKVVEMTYKQTSTVRQSESKEEKAAKRQKLNDGDNGDDRNGARGGAYGKESDSAVEEAESNASVLPEEHVKGKVSGWHGSHFYPENPAPTDTVIARPMGSMRGHTAFLTFAVSPPMPYADAATNAARNAAVSKSKSTSSGGYRMNKKLRESQQAQNGKILGGSDVPTDSGAEKVTGTDTGTDTDADAGAAKRTSSSEAMAESEGSAAESSTENGSLAKRNSDAGNVDS